VTPSGPGALPNFRDSIAALVSLLSGGGGGLDLLLGRSLGHLGRYIFLELRTFFETEFYLFQFFSLNFFKKNSIGSDIFLWAKFFSFGLGIFCS
jgi:hypothetical protein